MNEKQQAAVDAVVIPTVDLRDPEAAEQLSSACRGAGFFFLEGHGLSRDSIDRVFAQSRKLFALPLRDKQALSDRRTNRGYTALQEQTLDPARQTEGDTKEGFYLGRDIAPNSPLYDPSRLRGPNVWPDPKALPDFRPAMEHWHERLTEIGRALVELVGRALGLPSSHFEAAFAEPIATLRLLHYSQRESDPARGILACGAHTDFGFLTLLMTDEHPGLQIFHKNEWIDVPPRPEAFVVNIGDMLEVWTNGRFQSTLHRVVTTRASDGKDRYSIPFFFSPAYETVVACLDSCTDADHPPRYPPTTVGDYLSARLRGTHRDFGPRAATSANANATEPQ